MTAHAAEALASPSADTSSFSVRWAFLINYDEALEERSMQRKAALTEHFRNNCVSGSSFADGEEEEMNDLLEVGIAALSQVTEGGIFRNLAMRLKRFIREVAKR